MDAFFSAINAAIGHDARLKEFHVSAVTGGRDALGEVTVLLELDGQLASGVGVSTDILEASGKAYLRAISNVLSDDAVAEAERLLEHEARSGARSLSVAEFTWRDGERLIRFGGGARAPSSGEPGSTLRAADDGAGGRCAELTEAATEVVHVPPGRVDEISAELLARHSFARTSSWSPSAAAAWSTRPRRSPARSAPAARRSRRRCPGAEMTPVPPHARGGRGRAPGAARAGARRPRR